MYLGCSTNNVLIKDSDDIWLTDIFKHNHYYIIKKPNDEYDYAKHGIRSISDITEIEGFI